MKKSEALGFLDKKIATCRKCKGLSEYRDACNYKTVPGKGNPNAEVMFIGEAPGENEAKKGDPFIGKAGNLLTNIIESIGLTREQVFILNILKCRPPGNRDPQDDEAENCRPFLDLQIKVINPVWVVCLGRYASRSILKRDAEASMGSMRGQHEIDGRKVIATYHPSYLLRQKSAKIEVAKDLRPLISDLLNKK